VTGAFTGLAVFVGVALTSASVAADYTGQSDPAVTYSAPQSVSLGSQIHLSGSGWRLTDGSAGSVIAFKLDDGNVSTTLSVTNPATGAVQANKTIYGIVQADATGAWSVDLPFPTSSNSTAVWAVGQIHKITMLTGSLLTGDQTRSESAQFTVVSDGTPQPPTWPSQTLTAADGATAWIGTQVDAGDHAEIRIKGYRWLNKAGTAPSVVAIKLGKSTSQQYTHAGSDVVLGDPTIWAELSAGGDGTGAVYPIDSDGSFDVTLDAPPDLGAGQYLTVQLLSGKFGAADQGRSLSSDPLVVGGLPYDVDAGKPQVTCSTSQKQATASATVIKDAIGGTVRLSGAGWCHPGVGKGGSVVAVKLDDGTVNRLDTTVSSNKTIWTIIAADDKTGTFTYDFALPDGTAKGVRGSDPVFKTGGHSLTLLSGSLKSGDTVRSVTADFVIGTYRPSGIPAPLEFHEDLTNAKRGKVAVAMSGKKLTVGGLSSGAWAYLSVYGPDGSPRTPWAETWFRADAQGRVTASLAGITLPAGRSKFVVQSGAQGHVGDLLGWTWVTTAAPATAAAPPSATPTPIVVTVPPAAPSVTPPVATTQPTATPPAQAPLRRPAAPASDDSGLTTANLGQVTGIQDGAVVTLTVAGGRPGQWIYVYAYSTPTPVGWLQLDADLEARVDVSRLAFGNHKLAVLATDGTLLGWAPVTGTAAAVAVTTPSPSTTPVAAARTSQVESAGVGAGWWWFGAVLAVAVGGGLGAGLARRPRPATEDVR